MTTQVLRTSTALLFLGLMASCTEAIDDINSSVTCRSYCTKSFDCNEEDPTTEQDQDCVSACRDSMEDECGNEHQAAANEQVNDCVDLACGEFWTCMVFEAAPECFGFSD